MMQQTSLLTYHELKKEGELNRREKQVYNALKELRVASDRELANFTELEINQVTGRRNALVKKNLVVRAYVNKGQTGRQVIFWKLSDAGQEV